MVDQKNIWPKQISVDKRIVRILSAATYDNFPNALKEIITNSYDADASSVKISIDLKKESIIIEDDGSGMTEDDFSLYLRIAGLRRTKNPKTPSGRSIIGQFGVGFLSVFPFFKNYAIETKVASANEILHAEIPCHLYFGQNSIDISEINVQGGIRYDKTKYNRHYTRITLTGFTNLTRVFFYPKKQSKIRRNSILNETSTDILLWRLSEDLPLSFSDNKLNKQFDKFTPNLPFSVFINNKELTRRTYGKSILETNKKDFEQIGKIKFRYFICSNGEAINNPIEGRYLKIRNLNVGVGDRTVFGLGTEVGGARSRLQWLSGEIHLIEGLNDIITVSRDKFNYDTDYETLKELFISKLAFHSTQLEDEDKVIDFISSSKNENKISDPKLLSQKFLSKKIDSLKKGMTARKASNSTLASDKEIEKIISDLELDGYKKRITINNVSFEVVLDKWNYKQDFFPACKIEKKTIIVNHSYPLFKGVKYTDIFIKLNFYLVNSFQNGLISKAVFNEMSKDVLKVYKDYIK